MIVSLFISLLIPLSIGYFFVCSFWPEVKSNQNQFLIKSFLAVGVGLGICSFVFFIWLLVVGPSISGLIIFEIALLICLIGVFIYKTKRRKTEVDCRSLTEQTAHPIFSVSFYIVLIFSIASFVFISLKNPHGRWDAWAIWNMRARFLFRGGSHWKDGFSPLLYWSHPDYPLLIPGTVARCWKIIGKETLIVPALVSMFFTFAMAGLLFSALFIVRGKTQGFLAGMVLLGTPFFIEHGASQYADVPLGFFFLATLVLFSLHERLSENSQNLLFLAGMTTGMSLWTKNEGFLFLMAIIISRIIAVVPAKGPKTYFKEMFSFAMGVLPILGITLYLKTQLGTPNDLLSSQGYRAIFEKLTDFSRYLLVGKTFITRIFLSGGWIMSITFLLIIYILLLGIKVEEKQKKAVMTTFIALGLMLAGYFLVYIITPRDIHWQLLHALGRLLLQLCPSLIFIFFLVVGAPESGNGYSVKETV
jgi:hypothetical protein